MEYLITLPNRKAKYYWIDLGLAICSILLLLLGKWLPAILMLLMAVMGFLIRRKPYLHFSSTGIRMSMVWVKKYDWNQLNAVMLKDGMLTMDFSNNRLFQEAIAADATGIDENAFNAFCSAQIKAAQTSSL